ncbi:MAG: PRD domain-containing protein [Defluviitaleaceae bacterium]|nr:PRD domain-containing protein [Defluviitaleaceae bacterium]
MKVYKSINNNIVSAFDSSGREMVVIGKGIGYKTTEGAEIDRSKVTKIFVMDSQNNLNKLIDLFSHVQKEYVEITDEILVFAKSHLQKELNESTYFTLADHLSFAVERLKKGMTFENILLSEIKGFYPKEYEVGLFAIKQIKEKLGIDMPEAEAASIALHILNAAYYTSVSEAFNATLLLAKITEYIIRHTERAIDTTSNSGERFLVHLKYLVRRIITDQACDSSDDGIYNMVQAQYLDKIKICEKIAEEIKNTHNYMLSKQEIACMAIHMQRVGI